MASTLAAICVTIVLATSLLSNNNRPGASVQFNEMRPILTPSTAAAGAWPRARTVANTKKSDVSLAVSNTVEDGQLSSQRSKQLLVVLMSANFALIQRENFWWGLQNKMRHWGNGHWRSPPRVCESLQRGLIPISDLGSLREERDCPHNHGILPNLPCRKRLNNLLHLLVGF